MPEHKEKFSIGYIYLAFAAGMVFTILFFALTGAYRRPRFSVEGVDAPPPSAPLSILETEEKFDIEILHPTVRERQEHINRHGGLRGKFIKVDGWDEDETKAGAKWLRCNQEAVKPIERMAEGDKK